MNDNLIGRLNRIFCKVFDDDSIKLSLETSATDIDAWDSLSHVNLIMAIEAEFKMKFTQRELFTFRNVGDLVQVIERKTSG